MFRPSLLSCYYLFIFSLAFSFPASPSIPARHLSYIPHWWHFSLEDANSITPVTFRHWISIKGSLGIRTYYFSLISYHSFNSNEVQLSGTCWYSFIPPILSLWKLLCLECTFSVNLCDLCNFFSSSYTDQTLYIRSFPWLLQTELGQVCICAPGKAFICLH